MAFTRHLIIVPDALKPAALEFARSLDSQDTLAFANPLFAVDDTEQVQPTHWYTDCLCSPSTSAAILAAVATPGFAQAWHATYDLRTQPAFAQASFASLSLTPTRAVP